MHIYTKNTFLESVCKEVKFKKAHSAITKELSDHIEDQKLDFVKQGTNEETAQLKAIEEMGDPTEVGKRLNKAYKPRTEWSILTLAVILILAGGIIQYF